MGFALAEECASRGAHVTLISGPVTLKTQHPHIRRIDVESAGEMYEAASREFTDADAGILCAAVADFTPESVADHKIKREKDENKKSRAKSWWVSHWKQTTNGRTHKESWNARTLISLCSIH